MQSTRMARLLFAAIALWLGSSSIVAAQIWSGVTTIDGSTVTARHENGAVEYNGYIYVFGGRGDRPVERYDAANNLWETVGQAPIEMHHFQPVVYDNKIYIIGAFTCCYPAEPTLADIYIFDPADNTWSTDGVMPADRLRGSAGTFVRDSKIYMLGGN
ncbi:MAG: galactose oxidase, partial [Pseudomonadota bacterium]